MNRLNELHAQKEAILYGIKHCNLKEFTIEQAIQRIHEIDDELAQINLENTLH